MGTKSENMVRVFKQAARDLVANSSMSLYASTLGARLRGIRYRKVGLPVSALE